jgi:hypothetical protein
MEQMMMKVHNASGGTKDETDYSYLEAPGFNLFLYNKIGRAHV